MYGIALGLLVVAIAALAVGFLQNGLTLILVSIGASAGAGIAFVVDLLHRRRPEPTSAWVSVDPDPQIWGTGSETGEGEQSDESDTE